MNIKRKHNYLLFTNIDNMSIRELFESFHLSRKEIHLLRQNKHYLVNNQWVDLHYILHPSDRLSVYAYKENDHLFIPSNHLPHIIYEDDYLLIVDKPSHQEVYGSSLEDTTSLSNDVAYYYKQTNQSIPVRCIHRLDKDTTGLVIFVKCHFIHAYMDYLIESKAIKRFYKAIVDGKVKSQTINKPISRDRHENKMRIGGNKHAITHIHVLKNYKNYTYIECRLETGRTHQIRVHLASINHPLVGDPLYNKKAYPINRQALHAYKLCFIHPITNKELTIQSSIPEDFQSFLDSIQ